MTTYGDLPAPRQGLILTHFLTVSRILRQNGPLSGGERITSASTSVDASCVLGRGPASASAPCRAAPRHHGQLTESVAGDPVEDRQSEKGAEGQRRRDQAADHASGGIQQHA